MGPRALYNSTMARRTVVAVLALCGLSPALGQAQIEDPVASWLTLGGFPEVVSSDATFAVLQPQGFIGSADTWTWRSKWARRGRFDGCCLSPDGRLLYVVEEEPPEFSVSKILAMDSQTGTVQRTMFRVASRVSGPDV